MQKQTRTKIIFIFVALVIAFLGYKFSSSATEQKLSLAAKAHPKENSAEGLLQASTTTSTGEDDDKEDSEKPYIDPGQSKPILGGKELEEAIKNNDVCKIVRSRIDPQDHARLLGMEKDVQLENEIVERENNLNFVPDPADPLRILFLKTLAMSGLLSDGPDEIQPGADEMWQALLQRDPDNGGVYAFYVCYQNLRHENQNSMDESLKKMIRSSRFETQFSMRSTAQQERLRALPAAMSRAGFLKYDHLTNDFDCLEETLPSVVSNAAPEVKVAVGNWARTFRYFSYAKDDSFTSAFMIVRSGAFSKYLIPFGTVPETQVPDEFMAYLDRRHFAFEELRKENCNPQPYLAIYAEDKAKWEKNHR
jgi:hypothetical protein